MALKQRDVSANSWRFEGDGAEQRTWSAIATKRLLSSTSRMPCQRPLRRHADAGAVRTCVTEIAAGYCLRCQSNWLAVAKSGEDFPVLEVGTFKGMPTQRPSAWHPGRQFSSFAKTSLTPWAFVVSISTFYILHSAVPAVRRSRKLNPASAPMTDRAAYSMGKARSSGGRTT